jgi:D-threo-aldose 1-dehydrogenase
MIANSMTLKSHPPDLLAFMQRLQQQGVQIINSAVFHAGFLIGGDYYDYKRVAPDTPENKALFQWRADFFALCQAFGIKPAEACTAFALLAPGVVSIALNTTNPGRVQENVAMAQVQVPAGFWRAMQDRGLIRADYPFLPEA